MGVKELFLGVDLPADVKMLYHGLMKKKIDLQNGWLAIVLKNNLAIFFKNGMQMMSFGAVRNIVKNPDGKFMVIRENGDKAIWNAKGYCLAAFSKDTELFDNGWYRKKLNDGLALFDNNGECIGQNLRNTEVFSNGFYFMSDRCAGFKYSGSGRSGRCKHRICGWKRSSDIRIGKRRWRIRYYCSANEFRCQGVQ